MIARPTQRLAPALKQAQVVSLALMLGLVFALAGCGSPKQEHQKVAAVAPVPHAATAEQQARNLSAWLARYSSP